MIDDAQAFSAGRQVGKTQTTRNKVEYLTLENLADLFRDTVGDHLLFTDPFAYKTWCMLQQPEMATAETIITAFKAMAESRAALLKDRERCALEHGRLRTDD